MEDKPRLNKQLSVPSIKGALYSPYLDVETTAKHLGHHTEFEPLTIFERAVVVLEDRRYFEHNAIDFRSVLRELARFLTFRKHGGASTIEMQFVRTCTGYRQRTLGRKLYEMLLAWILLHKTTKLVILRSYLEIAYFGSGLTGAEETSQAVYGLPTYDLSERQACELASMLVYPRPLKPDQKWREKIERRSAYGMKLLRRLAIDAR